MGIIVFALFTFSIAVFANDVEPTIPGNEFIPIVPGKEITPVVPANDVTPAVPENDVTPTNPNNDVTLIVSTVPGNATLPISDNTATFDVSQTAVTPTVTGDGASSSTSSSNTSLPDTGNNVNATAAERLQAATAVAVSLDQELEALSGRLEDLEANVSRGQQRLSSMERELTTKDALIESLRQQVDKAGHDILGLDTRCKSGLDEIDQRSQTREGPVAFFVHFNEDAIDNLTAPVSHGQKLLFDVVQFQSRGTNYNKSTGVFTAPVSGTYLFSLTITRNDAELDECVEATVKSGQQWLPTVSACPPGFTTASNMAAAHLDKGDTVHVQSEQSQSIFGYIHTTFFGIKL